jgi:hypothetical protein
VPYAETCAGSEARGIQFSTADPQSTVPRVLEWIGSNRDNPQADATPPDPNQLNILCWQGSLWGHARDILPTCDRVVALDPSSPYFRDSRGLARALTGDRAGAIEDFRPYLESRASAEDKALRRRWIEDLEAGLDPFEPGDLAKLRAE